MHPRAPGNTAALWDPHPQFCIATSMALVYPTYVPHKRSAVVAESRLTTDPIPGGWATTFLARPKREHRRRQPAVPLRGVVAGCRLREEVRDHSKACTIACETAVARWAVRVRVLQERGTGATASFE